MKAREHTRMMLDWWKQCGIDQADLGVRQENGKMIWHQGVELDSLPLGWARAENARRSEIYVRPARGASWAVVFLDDVEPTLAVKIAAKYGALVVHTSPVGGCHVWLACANSLDEDERRVAQRWLAQRTDADAGSVSGEHLGRLAGVKNQKRSGTWINVLEASAPSDRRWDPSVAIPANSLADAKRDRRRSHRASALGRSHDASESAREWGWVCGALEAGCPSEIVCWLLIERARERRGRDAERYASHTVGNALRRVTINSVSVA